MGSAEAGQIYKIYINDSLLTISGQEVETAGVKEYDDVLSIHYHGKSKLLLNIVDNLEKSRVPRQIILTSEDVTDTFSDTVKLFRWIEAGGGVVRNKKGEILAIYRRKRWDLPKGKLDPGETFEEAAVREVIEETGIKSVSLEDLLTTTMHAFRTKSNVRALKVSKWYKMRTEHTSLKWQVEEDIEKAIWIDPNAFLNDGFDMYVSIRSVMRQYVARL